MKTKRNLSPIFLLGDIHGNFDFIYSFIVERDAAFNLIQLGDFGIRDPGLLEALQFELKKRESYLYVLRGNHDDPRFWGSETSKSSSFSNQNIKFLPDFNEFSINNINFYSIGGATSIDRIRRIKGLNWFEEEKINFSQHVKPKQKVDILLTHCAPMLCFPAGISSKIVDHYLRLDSNLEKDLLDERLGLEKIIKEVQPSRLYYGHYHDSNTETCYGVECRLLNINEILEIQ